MRSENKADEKTVLTNEVILMELCPHGREVLSLYIGMYRCSHCHLWLEAAQCVDFERQSHKEPADQFGVHKHQVLEISTETS
jgi:hypothetical protein